MAVLFWCERECGVYKGLTSVVDVEKIARDGSIDERRIFAGKTCGNKHRDEPRGLFQRPIDGIQPKIRTTQAPILAGVIDETSRGDLGYRIVTVGKQDSLFKRSIGMFTIF